MSLIVIIDADPPTNLDLKQIAGNRVLVTWDKSTNPVLDYCVYINDENVNSEGRRTNLTSYVLHSFQFYEVVKVSVRATSRHYWSEVLGPKTLVINREL